MVIFLAINIYKNYQIRYLIYCHRNYQNTKIIGFNNKLLIKKFNHSFEFHTVTILRQHIQTHSKYIDSRCDTLRIMELYVGRRYVVAFMVSDHLLFAQHLHGLALTCQRRNYRSFKTYFFI